MKSIRSSRRMNAFDSFVLRARRLVLALVTGLTVAVPGAHSAGVQFIDVPADTAGPPLNGAVWSPCATPAGQIKLGRGLTTPGTLASGLSHLILGATREQAGEEAVVPPGPLQLAFH
jgi:hypothetical protein